ncbi:unnamed protein product [Paramecium pentaurelia]|uniref:HECT-type E3 ubiquitin transferase n=1 Tax=Paramecium pentaurelia TaxID=43138 RepID=A0A8S1V7L0_9CILI|nr:unnamed protein product [Paramecium pentaurelia]
MGCISSKDNTIKLDRQSAYVFTLNQNNNSKKATTKQKFQTDDQSKQKIEMINQNNIFINKERSSHLKQATQILNINKDNQFKQKVETLKQYYKNNTQFQRSHQKDFDEIILHIQSKTITLQILLNKNDQLQMPPLDILFVINNEGKYLIELILNHIDNYDIITQLLLEQNLSESHLQIIAIPLFRKLKYLHSNLNVERAIQFLKATSKTKFIEVILIASLQNGNKNIIQNFSNIFTYINKLNELHLKFFKILCQIIKGVKAFEKKYEEYLDASITYKLKNFRISKKIKKGHMQDELQMQSTLRELQFNIFHQVSLNQKWDIFSLYSNSLIQTPNNSQLTPFMVFFQNAPFKIILKYIQQFPQSFTRGIDYSTSQGLNLLHCFCLNKNLSPKIDNNCQEIMNLLQKSKNFKQLLLQPYQDQIPLIFYLNRYKVIDQQFLDFLGQNLKKDFDFHVLDTQAQILGEQLKFRKINQKKSIKDLKRMKKPAFKYTQYELNIELSKEMQQQYDLYYLHYIQLMKIIIKRKFSIKYSHLTQFFTFTSYFPYDLGTTHHSFLQIMLQNQNDDLILLELKKFNFINHLQAQKKELDKFNILLPTDYSQEAQLLAKLIYLKQDIIDQSSQLHQEINQIILEQLKRNPNLLWSKIYGNSKLKYEGFNTTLYQLIKQLLDVVFVKDVLEISIYNNCQDRIMKEFIFQELLYRKVSKNEIDLRNFCDSFPRSIEFNETIKKIDVKVDKDIKNYQVKLYTWNLGLYKSENKLEITEFYLLFQQFKQKSIQNVIQQSISKGEQQNQQKITDYFLQALLESEVTLPLINPIINLNPKYFIPKIWWLTQKSSPNKQLLQLISTKNINPIVITQTNINQLDLFFDWQMNGVQFKIMGFPEQKYLFHDLLIKSQLICFQQINKLPFVIALAIDDYFNVELSKFLENSEIKKTKEIISQIQLHKMLQNQAIKNIQLLIDYFNLDAYSLIYILGLNHLSNSKLFEYTPSEIQEVNKFNFNHQIQQLLKQNFKYSDQICPFFIFKQQNNEIFQKSKKAITPQFIPLIDYLNYESLSMLDIKLRNQLYERLNFQIQFDKFNDERIMEILIEDIIKLRRQEFGIEKIASIITTTFMKAINNNKNIAEILCRHLSKEELQYTKNVAINLLYELSLISNQICIQYLNKLTLQNYQFLQVYYYALSNRNIELLNHLINYYYENRMSSVYVYNYLYLNINVTNYHKALYQKYYLVFNVNQYQLLYNTVKLNSQTISEHIQMFILFGCVDQLKFLIQQPNIQIEVQNFYFHYVFTKKMCIENVLGIEVNKFPKNLNNKQIQLQQFFLKNFKRTYQQFCKFSLYREDCAFNFYEQNIDYAETFEILNNIMSNSKEKTEELDGFNELYSLIIHPQAKQIKLKNELISYFCKLFIRTKTLNKYISDHYDQYILLFNANSRNIEIIFDFRKPKYFSLKFIMEILIEYIQQLKNINTLEIYERLTEYIFKYHLKNLKLVECLKLGLQNYNLTKFNQTTLYYAQNQVNLLPKSFYDYSKNKHFYNRYKLIQNIMNIDEVSLENMTPIQVLLGKGQINHVQQISYSNSNLMAALISNNFSTIQGVLDQSKNPKKICSDFKLFHIILKFQNEKNIISFFDKYIEDSIKDINQLMFLQDESILLSIVQKRQYKVFDRIIRQYVQKLTNSKTHVQIVQQHLQIKLKEQDLMIYQLGILQKSYFIFDFLDGIIQGDDIQQFITKLDFNLASILSNQQQGDRKINLFAKYYLSNLSILLIPTQKQNSSECQNVQNKNKEKKINDLCVWKKDNNNIQRNVQLDNLLDIEHACIYKLFGFNQFIIKYLKNNFKFFSLFQNQAQDILIAIDITKGHTKLLEFYLNSQPLEKLKDILDEVVKKCQQFYLIQNPIFYKIMLTYPEQFLRLLKPSDFNLEISLLLSYKLKQTQTLQNFIKNQLQMQPEESQNLNGIDIIQNNYLFMMSLFLNNFQLPILQTEIKNINIEILIKSLKFIEENFEKQQTIISNQGLQYILNLLNKDIVISNKNRFQQLINSQLTGQPIILGMIWIQQIQDIVQTFFSKLPQWGIFVNKVMISFDNVPISFNNEHYILPLQYKNDQFELDEIYINEFMSGLKQLKYERVMETESNRFLKFQEKWPQYNFNFLFKKINVNLIPSYCFENLDDIDLEIQNTKQNKIIQKKTSKQNYKNIKQKDEQLQENENNQENLGLYESMIFFKNLLDPFKENSENYHINDLQAPHKNQNEDEKIINESKGVQQKETGTNTFAKKLLKKKIEIIKTILPNNKYKSRFTNQQITIFMEFYHFIYPQQTDLFLQQLSSQEYLQQYNPKATLEFLIYKLEQYYHNLQEFIQSEKYEKWTITIPYYIENDQFIYQEIQFTPYAIQFIFFKLLNFIQTVRSFSNFEIDIIQWRINTISLLKVLVKAILDYQFLDNKSVDIFTILDSICQWNLLQLLLAQIIYRNLMSLPKVTNLFSRIYVEFQEKTTTQQQAKSHSTFFLDQIFQFEQTEYRIYNKTLIITLNVFIRQEKTQWNTSQFNKQFYRSQFNKSTIFQASQIDFHLYNVINESDFFFDVFQPEDLVSYFFNRQEIDQYIQIFSYQLSKFVNKDVSLIVNHTQLKKLYEDQIIEIKGIKDRKVKVQKQNQIQDELIRLKDFFLEKVTDSLFEQLTSESLEQLFLVKLSILLQSIRLNNQLSQSTQQNFRRAIKSTKSKVVEKIAKFSTHQLLSFQFGFQLTPTYFQQIVKVGDICMVLYQEDGQLKLEPCQFIKNQDSSILFFYMLQDEKAILNLDEIDGKLRASFQEKKILNLVFEDIITIIWFRSTWPIEQNFNDEILNLIFIDQNGNILACHEKKFLQKINMIQKFENEQQKQILLDNLFGQNLVSIYDKFALTQIIPIIPSQINYNFKFEDQQQSNVIKNNNDIDITISKNDFILDKLSIGNFNTACYFDSNLGIQKFVKKFNKFTQRIKEMSKILIKIYFDDNLNKHPSFYLEQFFAHNNIFEEFESGFKEFCEEKQFPQIENSLSYLFDVPSLTYLKERIFCQIVKQIEFHFQLNQTHELIQYQNGNLRIYMFANGDKPIKQDISCFISNLIVKYQEFKLSNLIIQDQLYDIEIQEDQQSQLSNYLANTILLTKYLYQLIQLKQNQKYEKKLTFLLQFNQQEQCFYKFNRQNRQIILQYNLLKDFCLDVFLLDYLNFCNYQGQIKYENLIVDNTLFNCQILQNLINVKDNQYFPQLKKEEKNLYISKDFSYLQILEGRLDPKEQERGFLLFQCKGVYQAIIIFKSQQKYIPLYQYFKQHENRQFFGQSFYFLVSGLNQRIDLDNQLNNIYVKIIVNNKKIKRSLNYYKRYNSKLNINTRLITTNVALVEIIVQGVKSVKIRSMTPSLLMSSINNTNYTNSITIQFDPEKTIQQSQNKLAHIGVLIEDQQNDQIYKAISFSQRQSHGLQTENGKIVQFLLKGIDYKPSIFQKTNISNSKFDLTDLQNENVITTLNQNQIKIASFCGQMRTDFMEFLDLTGSQIACENAIFVHSQYQQIYVQPKVFKETLGLKFKWQPIIKGIYNLYLGDQKIDGQFIVLANNVDYRKCEIILSEKINTLTLYQTIKFTIKLRDHLNNIYGDIEYKLNQIQPAVETENKFSNETVKLIGPNKEGIIIINITFAQKEDIEHQPEDVKINISLLEKLKQSYTFHLEGLNLEMRIIKYYQKLKFPKVFRELIIDRNKFGTDILKLSNSNFKCPLKIKFKGEEGSDDGGLRREFYNKIGEMIKSPQNGFFQQNTKSQTYFYSPKFNLDKERDQYALVFGKLIANSLLNKEIIGVPFAHQFWKLIFNQSITFEDLDGIMDENEFQNYKSLKYMTQEVLEMLEVNFTIIKAKETIQLIANGDKIFVSIHNKDTYLQRIAEYYIIERFQQITKKISEGIDQVLDKKLLIECFDFTEMHTLTVGSDEIQPEKVLELVKYQNGSDQLISFFQKFINQLETEQLHDFLQFTTGSPYLPWNSKPTIQIEFQESMKVTNLPRSQTCFYKLAIPYYKTYEEFKKKMEIAIEYGQEGFGQF